MHTNMHARTHAHTGTKCSSIYTGTHLHQSDYNQNLTDFTMSTNASLSIMQHVPGCDPTACPVITDADVTPQYSSYTKNRKQNVYSATVATPIGNDREGGKCRQCSTLE